MSSKITAEQQAIIDEMWNDRQFYFENGRFSKNVIRLATLRCWRIGPRETVSAQSIGRIYSERLAAEQNRPRAVRKTPEQLQMLQELYENDPYPTPGESILVTHDSGLEPKQVKDWFDNQRKKADKNGTLWSDRDRIDVHVAAAMWRAYKRNPEGYATALRTRQISHATGQILVQDEAQATP